MKTLPSSLSTMKHINIHIPRMKKVALLFIYLLISLPIIMGFSFPESNRGWKSATLDISASRLKKLLEKNKNTFSENLELYGSDFESKENLSVDVVSKLLDDEFYINRYLGVPRHIGIKIPTETKVKLLKDLDRKIRTDDFEYTFDNVTGEPKFIFFKVIKKSFPGSVFSLPEVKKVVFWQHRRYSSEKTFMVEFVITDKDIFESLEEHMYEKYGDEWKDEYSKGKIFSNVDSWKYGGNSIRLVRTKILKKGLEPVNMYSLAFLDIERTENVNNYMYTLMKLAPDIEVNAQ